MYIVGTQGTLGPPVRGGTSEEPASSSQILLRQFKQHVAQLERPLGTARDTRTLGERTPRDTRTLGALGGR